MEIAVTVPLIPCTKVCGTSDLLSSLHCVHPCPTQLHVVSQSLPVLPFQIEDAMRPDADAVSSGDVVRWQYTGIQHLAPPTLVYVTDPQLPHAVPCALQCAECATDLPLKDASNV